MSHQIKSKEKRSLIFGKYVLDSLAIGMYSDPLMTLREYVQNSADAIDLLPNQSSESNIEITVDGRNRSLSIVDNGVGVPSCDVERVLLSIGASDKNPTVARGFRGIGRLGGLGYCDKLIFVTKSSGESNYATCVFDAKQLRALMNDGHCIDTQSLVEKTTSLTIDSYSGSENDHFFKVQMLNLRDSRNLLLNVPAIRLYLSQVAPVPFHHDFIYGGQIETELVKHLPSYKHYCVLLNGEKVFKQYLDTVCLSKDSAGDMVKGIQFVKLCDDSDMLAFGWLGITGLLGIVSPASGIDGVRLRCGNILLGNKDTLSNLFKEARFNHYLIGELHVVSKLLIPNSRRDDFEDSDIKGRLSGEFLKNIGIPFSKKIRDLSKERGKTQVHDKIKILFEQALVVIQNGYLSTHQRDRIVGLLDLLNGSHSAQEVQLARQLSKQVSMAAEALAVQKVTAKSKAQLLDILGRALEVISSEAHKSAASDKMIDKIYRTISK